MTKYIVKRVILGIVTIWMVATLTFLLMHAVPGGPFMAEKSISKEAQEALQAKFGMDKPLIVQYKNYMTGILHGDFSLSLRQRGMTVNRIIAERLPVSAKLGLIAAAVAILIGVPLGSIAALKRGTWIDNLIITLSTCGIAFPSFVICNVLLFVFVNKMGLTQFNTQNLLYASNYVLPVFSLAFYPMAYITRLMRSSMLDVIGQDYMRTARAKGLSQTKCLFKHALRNAILPVITYAGPMIAYILTGSFVVEKIFRIPGLGDSFVKSITNRDYTVIMGTTIILASLVIIMNVIVDIVYKFVDPRIELK